MWLAYENLVGNFSHLNLTHQPHILPKFNTVSKYVNYRGRGVGRVRRETNDYEASSNKHCLNQKDNSSTEQSACRFINYNRLFYKKKGLERSCVEVISEIQLN
jgi:hypothetical protein